MKHETPEGEQSYRQMFEANPHPMWVYDVQTLAFLAVNDAAIAHYGYARDEFLAMTIAGIRPAEEVPRMLEAVTRVRNEPVGEPHDWQHRKKDGTLIDVEITSHELDFGGRGARLVLAHDVTERRRVEEALRASEVQLQAILESTADGILAVDRSGKVLQTNQRFGQMWRIPQQLLQSGDDQTLINYVLAQLRDPDAFLAKVQALYQTDAHDSDILFFKDARVFERQSFPLVLNGTVIGRVWSFHDVTKRVQAEEALRESRERFEQLTALSSDWYWEQDEQLRFIAMDGNVETKTGIGAQSALGKTRWEMPALNMSQSDWAEHRALLERHEPFHDLELHRPDAAGRPRWMSVSGRPRFAEDGRFLGYRGVGRDITGRKLAEQALRASEEKFAKAFRLSPDFMAISTLAEGRYIDVNEAFERVTGFARDGVIGRTAVEIGLWSDPADRARMVEMIRMHGRVYNLEARFRNKSGEVMICETSSEPLEIDGVSCILSITQDVTLRKLAERALADREGLLRAIYDSSDGAIFVVDSSERISFANQRMAEMFGCGLGELLGTEYAAHVKISEQDESRLGLRRLFRAEIEFLKAECEYVRKDESRFWGLFTARRLQSPDGAAMGVVAQIVDISERRAAVAEIRHLNATLEDRVAQRTAELTAANQALEEFSYSVAHDLRAPLRAIHGHASVIAEEDIGKLGDAGRAHLARIQVATKRMAQLIDGVLQLSRVTRTSLHREDTDLTLFAREIAGQLAKGSARNVEFRIGESIKAHADPTLIRVVMDNLLGNAWKFTRDRAPARIEFGLTTMDGERVFFVRDNGIGFDPAYADKLFQPFQRLHDENEYEGSGIGLAIVQRIIQHHRGRIWAEGAVDRGATFYFTLPQ